MDYTDQLCLPGFRLEDDSEFMQAVMHDYRMEIDRRNQLDLEHLKLEERRLLEQYETLRKEKNLPAWSRMRHVQAKPLTKLHSTVLPDKFMGISVTDVLAYLIKRKEPVKLSYLAERFGADEGLLQAALDLCSKYGAVHPVDLTEPVKAYTVKFPEMGP